MPKTTEYLIIGQGLAGSLLCQELLDAGKSVLVIDNQHRGAASHIAAGIINPITGRRFVKSWMIDELMPFAKKRFEELATQLNQPNFYQPRQLVRTLFSQMEVTDWLVRTAQEGWSKYVEEADDLGEFKGFIGPGFGQGILLGAQVDIARFVNAYRAFLKEKEILIEAELSVEDFDLEKNAVPKLDVVFEKIIWCEGAKAATNPLWDFIEFEPSKGEVFHLRIPGLATNRLLKHKMMMAPLGQELFWFGSNYEWNAENDHPSAIGRKFLQKRLDLMTPNYEEVAHVAAFRPTIKDRRPTLGPHPELDNWFIFNGLGTKGASLGPYFARHFSGFLLENAPLLPEVHIRRFRP